MKGNMMNWDLTIPQAILHAEKYNSDGKLVSRELDGSINSTTYGESIKRSKQLANALAKLGVNIHDRVATIAWNNSRHFETYFAVSGMGAILHTLNPRYSPDQLIYILNHAEDEVLIVDPTFIPLVESVQDKLDTVKTIIIASSQDGIPENNLKNALTYDELIKDESDEYDWPELSENDAVALCYTSGTTGLPKGVMLSHANISTTVIASTPRIPGLTKGQAKTLSFLPVCHSFERFIQYLYMYNGASIYYAEGLDTLKADLNMVQPNIFSAVPRLLEKFFDGIVANGTSAGGVKAKIFEWAVSLALKWEPEHANGSFYHWKLGIADKLVFSKIRAALGMTNVAAIACGSAALQPRLLRFFSGMGAPILEGYGLTETAPVISVNTTAEPRMIRVGYVGKCIKGVEAKIASDGEILAKGPNIMMGYYKQPELTAEVMTDGWFHTGDIGVIDDGFIKITDRKKEMFKTSAGKYIAPQLIENELKGSHLIAQSMVVGEGRNFPSAICILNEDGVKEWCSRHDIEYTDFSTMSKDQRIVDRVWKDVEKANTNFGQWEKIKKIIIDIDEFTVDNGCLTPTFKVKRKPILAKYESQIDSLYQG